MSMDDSFSCCLTVVTVLTALAFIALCGYTAAGGFATGPTTQVMLPVGRPDGSTVLAPVTIEYQWRPDGSIRVLRGGAEVQ